MQPYRILWQPKAEQDSERIYDYYENCRNGLGEEFLAELERCTEKYISIFPKLARIIPLNRRQYYLKRFPYSLIYLINESKKQIQILAILHHKQKLKR